MLTSDENKMKIKKARRRKDSYNNVNNPIVTVGVSNSKKLGGQMEAYTHALYTRIHPDLLHFKYTSTSIHT